MPQYRPLSETKFISDANLIAYWKLDGNSNDSIGAYNGTDTDVTYSAGHFGQIGGFNGTSSKIIKTSFIDPDSYNTGITYSIWAKKSNDVGGFFMMQHETAGWGGVFVNSNVANSIGYRFGAGSASYNYTVAQTIPLDVWNHYVITHNASVDCLYFNGKLIHSSASGTLAGNANKIVIGAYDSGSSYDYYCNGYLDDASVFARALSSTEVLELYQGMTLGEYAGAGSAITKGLWHLNGNSTDSSGNGKNLTNNGTAVIGATSGKFGGGVTLVQTSSQYLSIDDNLGIDGGIATFSCWVKPVSQPSLNNLNNILFQGTSGNDIFYIIGYENIAGVYNVQFNRSKPCVANQSTDITYTLSNGVWYHLVMTYDGTYLRGFVNGQQITTDFAASGYGTCGANVFYLGIDHAKSAGRYFDGVIDEVIVENVAWSPEKIKKYYTFTKGRFGI